MPPGSTEELRVSTLPGKPVATNQRVSPEFDKKICIYGGGSYAQAIGYALARKGADVMIIVTTGKPNATESYLEEKAAAINGDSRFAPFDGRDGRGSLRATANLDAGLLDRGLLIFGASSGGLSSMLDSIRPGPGTNVVSLCKSFVFDGWNPEEIADPAARCQALLAGPDKNSSVRVFTPIERMRAHHNFSNVASFSMIAGGAVSKTILNNDPFDLTVASTDENVAELLKGMLHTDRIGVDTTKDIRTLELVAIIKNPVAIACGIAYALRNPRRLEDPDLVDNKLKYDVLHQGIFENLHIAHFLEGNVKHRTLLQNVFRDYLISTQFPARNFRFGRELVWQAQERGASPAEVLRSFGETVEGLPGIHGASKFLEDITLPLLADLHDIIRGKAAPDVIGRRNYGSKRTRAKDEGSRNPFKGMPWVGKRAMGDSRVGV